MNDNYSIMSENYRFSNRSKHISVTRAGGGSFDISFIYGFPAVECMPGMALAQSVTQALTRNIETPQQYGGVSGSAQMVGFLCEKLRKDQGIHATPENIILTSGSMQALGLIADLYLDPGDTLISEAPSFLGAVRVLKNTGADVIGVSMDEDGINVDELADVMKKLAGEGRTPKFLYIIPNFHNPTGVNLTLARRHRLIEIAQQYNSVILEDDAYYDLRFRGQPLPTLYELAGRKGVIYVGTFSKTVAPALRLGWAVGDPEIIARISAMKYDGTSPFSASTAYEFCKDGGLDTNIAKLRTLYAHRAEVMVDALSEFMPAGVKWSNPDGGFFIWVTLPKNIDAATMLAKTRVRGVDYLAGAFCFPDARGKNNIRLAFSYAPLDKIPEGIRILAECVRESMG